jgi:diadenosine tetraphosphate (Ap4A) HIT family hydrolase
MSDAQSCPFCSLQSAQIVAEHPLALAFRDRSPLSKGHSLVIPRRHVISFFDCTAEERAAMLVLLDEIRTGLDREYAPDGYNIGLNNGVAAGQTVMHAHMHLIPRYTGDSADPRGGVRWILPEKAAYWRSEQQDERPVG